MIKYEKPGNWIIYDSSAVSGQLAEAKATVLSLQTIPYQRAWVEALQDIQLKMEVAGTSKIEGAEFTERELDAALRETPQQLNTRAQRQARAALVAYKWIAMIPDDQPITAELICEIHRRIVTGADDDHCAPGQIRARDANVIFGSPRHCGCEGGDECSATFEEFSEAIQTVYRNHDPLVAALAVHYHFAAMHPFEDGNGRTARALEALMLQRAGLRDICFIAMSNYYYDEKQKYLAALAAVRANNHDLSPFVLFGLRGIASQTRRLLVEVKLEMKKVLFRALMNDLSSRLRSKRKRVMADRQRAILEILLTAGKPVPLDELTGSLKMTYQSLRNRSKALIRDLENLVHLGAIRVLGEELHLEVNIDWPQQITESKLFEMFMALPRAKTSGQLISIG